MTGKFPPWGVNSPAWQMPRCPPTACSRVDGLRRPLEAPSTYGPCRRPKAARTPPGAGYALLAALALLAGCAATGPDAPAPETLQALPAPQLAQDPAIGTRALDEAGLAGFATREEASNARAAEAWALLAEERFEAARESFNQALMLNPDNFHPYWGFGQLALERGRAEEAVRNLEKAMRLVDDPEQEVVLFSDAGTAYSIMGEQERRDGDTDAARRSFERANALFEKSARLEPDYGDTYRWWAMALYREQRYRGSWLKVELARRHQAAPLPPGFLDALTRKMPQPVP